MRRDLMLRSPFAELERIRREFDRLLEELIPGEGTERAFAPAVEMYETDKEVVVKAELPGVKKENIEVSIKDNMLHIRGEKKEEREEKTETVHRVERAYGKFERALSLPAEVKTDEVKAEFKDGVLEIRLPKAEVSKDKKIEIK